MIIDPPARWIDISFHRNLYLETVTMHAPAFVTLRRARQSLRRFKGEILRQASAHGSHPALRRRPDELVHLQLKADIESVRQNPFHDFTRINPAEDGREQNGVTALWQIKPAHFVA